MRRSYICIGLVLAIGCGCAGDAGGGGGGDDDDDDDTADADPNRPDGAPGQDADNPPPPPPGTAQVRHLVGDETVRVDPDTGDVVTVLRASYGGKTRADADPDWDLRDPVTGRYIAQYLDGDGAYLWSVADGEEDLQRVEFESIGSSGIFDDVIWWGVMSADGELIYLSGPAGVFVASRTGDGLTFSALQSAGPGAVVHDISANGTLALVSGIRDYKWGSAAYITSPRQVNIFRVNADGTFGDDLTDAHSTYTDRYTQTPHFAYDSDLIVHEGDDDADTGDRIWYYRMSTQEYGRLYPQAAVEEDFNTPCVLPDGRIAFWESVDADYAPRVYDPVSDTTGFLHEDWYPFSGYMRCR